MDLQIKNKTALVTGSSKGIGEAIALALAREEVEVVVHGRERAQADRVVDAIVARGGRAVAVHGDLTSEDDVKRLVAEAQERVGSIDILVNNAGGSGPKSDWRSIAVNDWASSYDRNVLSALRVAACLLPAMRQRGWGRIISISSVAAAMPPPTGADYSAAKAAVNALTNRWPRRWRPKV
jgi:3-oxoacyl-[acyl-carrier protein] reductase